MRIAIFATSDSLTDKMIPELRNLLREEGHKTFLRVFSSRPMLKQMVR